MKNKNKILGVLKYFFTSPSHKFTGKEIDFLGITHQEWELMVNVFPIFIAKDNVILSSGRHVNYQISRNLKNYFKAEYAAYNKQYQKYLLLDDDINQENFWVISFIIYMFFFTQKEHEGHKDLQYAAKISYGLLERNFGLSLVDDVTTSTRKMIYKIVENFNNILRTEEELTTDQKLLELCEESQKTLTNHTQRMLRAMHNFKNFIFPHKNTTKILNSLVCYNHGLIANFLKPENNDIDMYDANILKQVLIHWDNKTRSNLLSNNSNLQKTHYFIEINGLNGSFEKIWNIGRKNKSGPLNSPK